MSYPWYFFPGGAASAGRAGEGLSDRDRSVLVFLEALHFLTTRQVERLAFRDRGLTPLSAARSCRRVLARLFDLKLIDRLERRIGGVRAGSASFVITLSPLGARLLGHDTRRRSREPSLAHLDHVLAVSDIVVRLYEAERLRQVELLDVEAEPGCWRSFVSSHGVGLVLKPDLRLSLGAGDDELHWFVEVDRGTEHRPVIERKCRSYLAAWRDGGEQRRAGIFPGVLWLVPDADRLRHLRSAIAAVSEAPDGMFSVALDAEAVPTLLGGPS